MPESDGCILAANHINFLDVFPLQLAVDRTIYFMAKAELHANPLADAFLRRLGSFPVDRGKRDQWALEHAVRLLQKGRVVGIFPEGTRSRGHGLRPAKSGAARLALRTGRPIVPVGISGVDRPLGLGPYRMEVHVRFAPPLDPKDHKDAVELTDRVMYTIASRLPPEKRGAYRSAPPGFPDLGEILTEAEGRPPQGPPPSA